MYGDPDIAAVPDSLRPLVEAALAKDPQVRPTAQQLLDRLTGASRRADRINDTPTQVILSKTWQTGLYSSPRPADEPDEPYRVLPREPSPPAPQPRPAPQLRPTPPPPSAEPSTDESPSQEPPAPEAPPTGKIPVGRRMATLATSAIVAIRRRHGRRTAGRPQPK
jgi:hypothetical protein